MSEARHRGANQTNNGLFIAGAAAAAAMATALAGYKLGRANINKLAAVPPAGSLIPVSSFVGDEAACRRRIEELEAEREALADLTGRRIAELQDTCDAYETANNEYADDNDRLRGELDNLRAVFTEADAERKRLREEKDTFTLHLRRVEIARDALDERLRNQARATAAQRDALDEAHGQLDELRGRLVQSERQQAAPRELGGQHRGELEALAGELRDAVTDMREMHQGMAQQQRVIEELRARNDALTRHVQLAPAGQDLVALTGELQAAHEAMAQQQQVIDRLTARNDALTRAQAAHHVQLAPAGQDLAALAGELQAAVTDMHQEMAEQQQVIDRLKRELQAQTARHAQSGRGPKDMARELQEARERMIEQQESIDGLKTGNTTLKQTNHALKQANDALTQGRDELEKRYAAADLQTARVSRELQAQTARHAQSAQEPQDRARELQEALQETSSKMQEQREVIDGLKSRNRALKQTNATLKQERDELETRCATASALTDKNQRLRDQVTAERNNADTAKHQLRLSVISCDEQQALVAALRRDMVAQERDLKENMRAKCDRLDASLHTANANTASAEEHLANLARENARLNESINSLGQELEQAQKLKRAHAHRDEIMRLKDERNDQLQKELEESTRQRLDIAANLAESEQFRAKEGAQYHAEIGAMKERLRGETDELRTKMEFVLRENERLLAAGETLRQEGIDYCDGIRADRDTRIAEANALANARCEHLQNYINHMSAHYGGRQQQYESGDQQPNELGGQEAFDPEQMVGEYT